MLHDAMSRMCSRAADEDRFESRNLDDSDAHSEVTGTTEEDLRPVKVSTCPARILHLQNRCLSCKATLHAFSAVCTAARKLHDTLHVYSYLHKYGTLLAML